MIAAHNSDIGLAFYNDRVKEIIAADIIAEPFTYVPIKAGHVELVGGNAIVFGKITEGYDTIVIDVQAEISYEDVALSNPRVNLSAQVTPVGVSSTVHYPDDYSASREYYAGDFVKYGGYTYQCLVTTSNNAPPYHGQVNTWWVLVLWDGVAAYRRVEGVIIITIPANIYVNSYYNVTVLNVNAGIPSITGSYEAVEGDTPLQVKNSLQAALIAAGLPTAAIGTGPWNNSIYIFGRVGYYQDSPIYQAGDINTLYKDFVVSAYILSLGNTIKFPQLKCGAVHSFGIVYKDRGGRTCSIVKCDAMDVYIPFYTEATDALLETIINLVFKIYNKPPSWAESYEIVYFGNVSMNYFLQLRENNITKLTLGTHRYSLNIQETFDWTYKENNRWKVPPYVWLQGDRLRLLGSINEATGVVTKYTIPLYSGEPIGGSFVYDYEIEETGTQYGDGQAIGGEWLIFQAVNHPTPFDGQTNILVEIYRPQRGFGQTVAYGTGMAFEIGTDSHGNKYHKGDVDQVFDATGVCVTPASVNNTANDCWKFQRLNYKFNTADIEPFWAESIFPSDWWGGQIIENKLTSAGFPFLDDLSQRQTVLNERIRHGGFLIIGTRTNNIAHFTFADFRDLAEKDGDITGLREVGYTLKIIQRYKETSIYINRTAINNPDGTQQMILTDNFLGTIRPMEDDWGCQHPDSIMVNGRNLYYWDNSQGSFIRSAPNGQQVLSGPEYKMSRHFKEVIKWVQLSGGSEALQVRIGANNEHKEIWIVFRMYNDVRGLIFSEKQDRFISHIDQITESYVHLGNFFAHLYQQRLWIMNIDEGQGFLSWSGTLTYGEAEVVSNAEPLKNKVFNAVALFADHLLQSLAKYIHIPKEASGANELMESNIPVWEKREGVYFGEIMKDENSKGNFTSLYDKKLNGREMRGRYCFVKVRSEEHSEKVRIDSIVIFSTPSERNI